MLAVISFCAILLTSSSPPGPSRPGILDATPKNMYSLKQTRAFIKRLEREHARRKPGLTKELNREFEKRLEFYKMREHLLMVRALPGDTLDQSRFKRAVAHRDKMPTPPVTLDIGTGWTFFGPRGLPGGGNMGIGPNTGRVNDVAYDPQNPSTTFYVAGATGGLCKTTDFANGFSIISDSWDYTYTGAVAVDPTNSSRVYVGTGDYMGWWGYGFGLRRSTNGGSTWITELEAELDGCEVSDILIHPDDPNVVLVSAGRGTGSFNGAGIWRSTDFGNTWTRVLAINEDSGIASLEASGNNRGFRYLYAGGGDEGRFYRSDDGGATWDRLSDRGTSMVAVAASTTDWDGVYAYAASGAIFKSTNGGTNWTNITGNFDPANFRQTTFNYMFGCLNTVNDGSGSDVLMLGMVDLFADINGDGTWQMIFRNGGDRTVHPDYHGFDRHPTLQTVALISNDGGVFQLDFDAPGSFNATNLNQSLRLTEHVHGSYHPDASQFPNYALTGMWHNGVGFCTTDPWSWDSIHGADGMYTAIDDIDPQIQFSSWQELGGADDGTLQFYATDDAWATSSLLQTSTFVGDNFSFITPWDEIPGDKGNLYFASQKLYRVSWTGGNPTWTKNIGQARFGADGGSEVALAVEAVSSASDGVFVGTSAGRLFGSLTPTLGMTLIRDWAEAITCIAASPLDADDLLVARGNAGSPGGTGALVEVLDALGGNPQFIDRNGTGNARLPDIGVNWIVRDPFDPTNIWYAATDVGVFYTNNRGTEWYQATGSLGLPNAMVLHLAVSDGYLYASTFGRGLWRMQLASARPRLTNFTINASAVTGGNPVPVTITLDREASPGGVDVTLNSNDEAAIPDTTVTVQEGRTSQSFNLPSNQTSSSRSVAIQASANGGGVQDSVTVNAVRVSTLTIPNTTGGNDVPYTITLDRAAPQGGARVDLIDTSQFVTVPQSVTIPAGDSSISGVWASTMIPNDTNVGVQATRPGSGVQETFTLFGVRATSVSLTPNPVWNTNPFQVRVTLNRPAPMGGFPVELLSSTPSVAQVPANLVVPPGQQMWGADGTTSYVPVDRNVTIRATIWGDPWENVLTVRHLGITSISFSPNPVVGGRNTTMTIRFNRTVDRPVTFDLLSSPHGWIVHPNRLTLVEGTNQVVYVCSTNATTVRRRITVQAQLMQNPEGDAFKSTVVTLTPPVVPRGGPTKVDP